ncbi:MAG: 7-carboxy-7-deazaguanine synthase [Rhodospirillaceae bacterium]|nr:7-carboxy-7-deazaguanine synthase [Rhodospirillaceae bacterium]
MKYSIKEMHYTLQGEGARSGRAAVFCRFSGCNLWSGREKDRTKAICNFCDTDFVGTNGHKGGVYKDANSLAAKIAENWPKQINSKPYVVFTGGEPLLQLNQPLISAMHERYFEIAIETNGTIAVPNNINWVCVSPKRGSKQIVLKGNELKLIYPQQGIDIDHLESLEFEHLFIQPMDNKNYTQNLSDSVDFCLKNPRWRLSIQTHKILGIP